MALLKDIPYLRIHSRRASQVCDGNGYVRCILTRIKAYRSFLACGQTDTEHGDLARILRNALNLNSFLRGRSYEVDVLCAR